MSAWVRAGGYTVSLAHVVAIRCHTEARTSPDGETLARPVVVLYLDLPSPHDGQPWAVTARGADAFVLMRLAGRLVAGRGAPPDEQELRDGGLGDMAASVE